MEKMICIPVWRYELMLKTFDQAMKELEELKKALAIAESGGMRHEYKT